MPPGVDHAPARAPLLVAAALLVTLSQSARGQGREPVPPPAPAEQKGEKQDEARWKIAPTQELADLLDAASAILHLPIEYERSVVAGPLTLRLPTPLRDEELLDLVHRSLAAKSLTTMQMPGSRGLTVVAIDKAASFARLEERSLRGAQAGFVKVLIDLQHDRVDAASDAIKLVLSKAGTVTGFKDTRTLLVSDLRPNVAEAIEVAAHLDGPFTNLDVFEVHLEHTSPTNLVPLLERISQTKKAVFGEKPAGSVLAHPEGNSVLVVAPPLEREVWEDLVRRFDRADPVQTLNYSPRRFGVKETAKLVQDTLGPQGQGDGWRLVTDELTGTLVITATPAQHRVVQELFDRLEGSEKSPRRPLRSYPVKHRGVEELRDLLVAMLEKGALKDLPEVRSAPSGAVVDHFPGDKPQEPGKVQGVTAPIPSLFVPRADSTGALGDELVVTADKATNRLIALGPPRVLEELEHLIADLDVREPQVMVEALVVSLSDTQTRSLGVELQKMGVRDGVQYKLGSLFGLGGPSPSEAAIPALAGSGASGVVLDPGSFSALVKALETVNQGRTLTIPKVLVSNQQAANLNSVLQTPFTSTNANNTVATTSFGGTQDAGTEISVTPRITEGDELLIDYTITLSSFVGDAASPTLPPPRQQNKLKSQATVPDGYTVAVGGLEVETEGTTSSRVPLLGSIPLVGALFSSQSRTKTRSHFYVFLRTSVLRAQEFEDLRYVSEADLRAARVEDGWPKLEPRVIR